MTKSRHIIIFDALRGLAALAVFLHHLLVTASGRIDDKAYLAVDFFFVLSGYVLAASYEPRAAETGAAQFLVRRAIRLYPMVLLGTALGAVAWSCGLVATHHLELAIAFQIMFVPQLWQGGQLFLLNLPQWSLMYELAANISHAFVLVRLRLPWLIALAAFGALGLLLVDITVGNIDSGWARWNFAGGAARLLFGYVTGIVIWRWHSLRASDFPGSFAGEWLVLPTVLIVLLSGHLPLNRLNSLEDPALLFGLVGLVAIAPGIAVPRFAVTAAKQLGEMSYPLYAIHFPLLTIASAKIAGAGLHGQAAFCAWLAVAVVVPLVAIATGRWIDAPIRHWLEQRIRAPRRAALTAERRA